MNKRCILFVFMLFCLGFKGFSQTVNSKNFTADYVPFNNTDRQFNDWSVSIYAGLPWLQSSDFTSIDNGASGKWRTGYDFQLSINKQISHAFALSLLGQYGKTNQGYGDDDIKAYTDYLGISLLGDLNLSSIFRRVDNRSNYRWALHLYAGVGTIQYKAYTKDIAGGWPDYVQMADVKLGVGSFFGQVGGGLAYKLNNRFDLLLKAMYVITGDNAFDGSGETGPWAHLHPGGDSDNFITTSLGLNYKIGKHSEFLGWVDPLRDIYTKLQTLEDKQVSEVCVFGDKDDDGVCDDWDRELNTPKGARVDGSGVALDVDMDGVIDLYDKCPTFPGPASNDGCPLPEQLAKTLNDDIIVKLGGINFNFDSDRISLDSQPVLDQVADAIIQYGGGRSFLVEGHTDAVGTHEYNMNLSKRRVASVIKYLASKGVSPSQLTGRGMGATDLKNPECNPASKCPEWKNKENRRVVFKLLEETN